MPSIEDVTEFEAPHDLPPLWGKSFWWTRAGAFIGTVAALIGAAMLIFVGQHLGSCGLPRQLTAPTLAIELVSNWQDVTQIVGTCESSRCLQTDADNACTPGGACQIVCPDKIRALALEQYFDYCLIVAYWLFFLYLGVVNWRFCFWNRLPLFTQVLGKACALVTVATASYGAAQDWQENEHILNSLAALHLISGPDPIIRNFAYLKWRLLFIAIGAASPVFIFWTGKSNETFVRRSAFSHLLARFTAVLALATSWTGVAASVFGDDQRLEVAAKRLALVLVVTTVTLATAQVLRGGTMAALNRLASVPGFRFLASLFSAGDTAAQTPDIDPSRTL